MTERTGRECWLPSRSDLRSFRWWAVNVLIVAAIVGYSRLGAVYTIADGQISPVWPVAGVALALVVLFGLHRAGAVVVAFALTSALITGPRSDALTVALVAVATGIGTGGATVLGAHYLVTRGFRPHLGRIIDVWRLFVAGCVVAVASAAVGIPTFVAIGAVAPHAALRSALFWMTGDLTGVFLAAPVLFVFATAPAPGSPRAGRTNALMLLGVALLIVTVAFAYFDRQSWAQLAAFALAVALAVRCGPRGAALAIVAQFSILFPASSCCRSPFGGDTALEIVMIGQAVTVVLGFGLLMLAAACCGARAFEGLPEAARTAAIVALIGAAMAGGVHIVTHEALEHLTVAADDVVFASSLIAVLLLLPLVRSHWRILRFGDGIDKSDEAAASPLTLRTAGILLVGGIAFGAAEMALLEASLRIGTGPALALGHVTPVLLVLGGIVATRRLPRGTPAVAAAAATLGILLAGGILPWGGAAVGPTLLALSASVCAGVFLACLAHGRRTVGPIVALYGSFVGVLVVTSITALSGSGISPDVWKPEIIGEILFFSVGSIIIPNILYSWSIRQIGPSRVSTLQTLTPVFGLLAAWLFLGEALSWASIAGFALVVGSVVLLEREDDTQTDVPGLADEMSLELLQPVFAPRESAAAAAPADGSGTVNAR